MFWSLLAYLLVNVCISEYYNILQYTRLTGTQTATVAVVNILEATAYPHLSVTPVHLCSDTVPL